MKLTTNQIKYWGDCLDTMRMEILGTDFSIDTWPVLSQRMETHQIILVSGIDALDAVLKMLMVGEGADDAQ